jgi:hypothetical protein
MPRPADREEDGEKRPLRAAGDAPTPNPRTGPGVSEGVEAPVGGAEDPRPSAPPEAVVAVAEAPARVDDAEPGAGPDIASPPGPLAQRAAAVAGEKLASNFRIFPRGDDGEACVVVPPEVGEAGAEDAGPAPAVAGGGVAGRGGKDWSSRMARAVLVSLLPAATGWRHTVYRYASSSLERAVCQPAAVLASLAKSQQPIAHAWAAKTSVLPVLEAGMMTPRSANQESGGGFRAMPVSLHFFVNGYI